MELQEELLSVMKKHLVKEETYINPDFLQTISEALWDCYSIEDEDVDRLISEMWSW